MATRIHARKLEAEDKHLATARYGQRVSVVGSRPAA